MKDTYYFSHDANALSDIKILNMRADYGLEGYGLFWAIIECLRCEESYSLLLDKKTYRAIKISTATSIDVEKFINDCINEYDLFKEENGFFYSASLKRRMNIKDEKREHRSLAGKKGAAKRWKNENETSENFEENVDEKIVKNDTKMAMPIEENNNNMTMLSNNNGNAITMPIEKMANDGKVKESKVKKKKVKESKFYIKLNETTLNFIFNLIINNNTEKIAKEYGLRIEQVIGYFNVLKRLELLIESKSILNLMFPRDVEKYKLCCYVILELYVSSYKVFLDKLRSDVLINKYEKTREYIGDIKNEDDLNDFVAYFIKCLQNELENLK